MTKSLSLFEKSPALGSFCQNSRRGRETLLRKTTGWAAKESAVSSAGRQFWCCRWKASIFGWCRTRS